MARGFAGVSAAVGAGSSLFLGSSGQTVCARTSSRPAVAVVTIVGVKVKHAGCDSIQDKLAMSQDVLIITTANVVDKVVFET